MAPSLRPLVAGDEVIPLEEKREVAMNLRDAQLCIDCEWIYALADSCPRCGSAISFPVARALDHEVHSVAHLARPLPVPSPVHGARATGAGSQ